MTPEDKELVAGLNEGGCGEHCDILCRNAAEAIARLSTEVETWRKDAIECGNRVAEMHTELAALRAQIAEAQPVGEIHQWRRKNGDGRWRDATKEFAYSRVDDQFEARTLYLHPAADAKDAERYRWLRTAGAWESEIGMNALSEEPAKFDAGVDAAMQEGK